jgi:hypothetical protein
MNFGFKKMTKIVMPMPGFKALYQAQKKDRQDTLFYILTQKQSYFIAGVRLGYIIIKPELHTFLPVIFEGISRLCNDG